MTRSKPHDAVDSAARVGIGARLRAERERLGLTQKTLADHLRVQRQALLLYEAGVRSPLADQLQAFAEIGGDVNYVITGKHAPELDDAHKEELELAMSAVVLVCRRKSFQLTEIQKLRLAFELAEAVRDSDAADFSEAKVFSALGRSIDALGMT